MTRGEPNLDPVRIVLACSAFDEGGFETAALAEEFQADLRSWSAALGLTFELSGTGFLGSPSEGFPTGPAWQRELSEDELERQLTDPTVYFVAFLLRRSSAVDEQLAASVMAARSGGAYSRYRIFVDDARLSAVYSLKRPQDPGPTIRALPHLNSRPLRWLAELAFGAITEMLTLDLQRSADADLPPGTSGVIGTGEPDRGPESADLLPIVDENVQFTVYRPRAVRPGSWYPLLAFAHLAERRPDAPPEDPDPIELVKALADQILGDQASAYASPTSDARGAIPKESELTFVPRMDGVEFNPPRRTFQWSEDVHKEEFRLRAEARPSPSVVRGQLTVFLGAFILADVTLVITLDETAAEPPTPAVRASAAAQGRAPAPAPALEPASARPYRKIFPSYSHHDSHIVEQAERLGAALGDVYLRDRTSLRSGEDWNERLLELIDEADVFQLFWSSNSMRSQYVREEWEHAVALARSNFIRPTYWEEPMPHSNDPMLPPKSLSPLHFHSLVLENSSRSTGESWGESERLAQPVLTPPCTRVPVYPAERAPSTQSVLCRNCGELNKGDTVFCVSCGSFLAWHAPSARPGTSSPPVFGSAPQPAGAMGQGVDASCAGQSTHPDQTKSAKPGHDDNTYPQSSSQHSPEVPAHTPGHRRATVPLLVLIVISLLLLVTVLIFWISTS